MSEVWNFGILRREQYSETGYCKLLLYSRMLLRIVLFTYSGELRPPSSRQGVNRAGKNISDTGKGRQCLGLKANQCVEVKKSHIPEVSTSIHGVTSSNRAMFVKTASLTTRRQIFSQILMPPSFRCPTLLGSPRDRSSHPLHRTFLLISIYFSCLNLEETFLLKRR